ncbi:CoA-binding protein [Sphingomonas ginkgonis]|uniref:CoA-binding protein n=1 Tax=Sphingomonas ginkgonis TaxID=2315330 RepID=A0A3R9Z5H5_9SPHN|nr:CoA-binding protein [Sphingomonas ginkgonis]RST30231.1 CoA-binding protein [Sphingomonas ginkgonis]
MPLTSPDEIASLLESSRTIAMVGASDNPGRASYGVMRFLQQRGWRVIPVNPRLAGQELLGETVVARLADVGEPIDLVDVFRRSEEVGPVVDEAIAAGAGAIWMQLGVVNDAAAARAEAAGLKVVMDHCPKIEVARLGIAGPA